MDSFRCPLQRPSRLLLSSSAPYGKLLSLAAMLHSLDHSAEGSAEASVQFVTWAVSRGHRRICGSHSLSCIPLLTVPSPHSSLSSQLKFPLLTVPSPHCYLSSQFPHCSLSSLFSLLTIKIPSPHCSLSSLLFPLLTVPSPHCSLSSQLKSPLLTVPSPHSSLFSQFDLLTVFSPHNSLSSLFPHLTVLYPSISPLSLPSATSMWLSACMELNCATQVNIGTDIAFSGWPVSCLLKRWVLNVIGLIPI